MGRVDEVLERYRQLMDEFGWAVVGVAPTVAEPEGEIFTYTVGLSKWDCPELICFGLPLQQAADLLNGMGALVERGQALEADMEVTAAASVPLRLVRMPSTWRLSVARVLFDSPILTVRALQLVWPDADGNWPWSPDAPRWLKLTQPVDGTWHGTD